jgi:hypothetical protein
MMNPITLYRLIKRELPQVMCRGNVGGDFVFVQRAPSPTGKNARRCSPRVRIDTRVVFRDVSFASFAYTSLKIARRLPD